MKLITLPLLAVVLLAGCSAGRTTPAAPASTVTVTAYAVDTATGDSCPRWGNMVVTPPNGFVSHPMSVDVPICNASISSVN